MLLHWCSSSRRGASLGGEHLVLQGRRGPCANTPYCSRSPAPDAASRLVGGPTRVPRFKSDLFGLGASRCRRPADPHAWDWTAGVRFSGRVGGTRHKSRGFDRRRDDLEHASGQRLPCRRRWTDCHQQSRDPRCQIRPHQTVFRRHLRRRLGALHRRTSGPGRATDRRI